MSGKSDNIPDLGKGDKCDLEDFTVDSGFVSGQLSEIYSGELRDEDIQDLQEQQKDTEMLKETNVCFDSGLGLTDSFSNMSLQKPDTNNLSSCIKSQTPVGMQEAVLQNEIWQKYYAQDNDGDTHLHHAIVCGRREIVEALVKIAPHPKLLDTPNDDAQTPLHLAVETNQHLVVRLLVAAGAKTNPRDVRGDSPLHIASRRGDHKCIEALLSPVQRIERDRLDLKYTHQLNAGADLNQWNYLGQTCVHVAALNGHTEMLRQLYTFGANINAKEGCMGYTALHMAVERKDETMVKFLLEECPKLDAHITTYGGKSALQLTQFIPEGMLGILNHHEISPYNSEDEDDMESDDDMYEIPYPVSNMVGASA